MTVLVLGIRDEKIAVKESVAEVADLLDCLVDGVHIELHDRDGSAILVHRDILDLVTS